MRRAFFALSSFFAVAGVAALTAVACDDTTSTTTFTPITGILIESDSLVQGIGCGTADSEVYEYVAFVAPNASSSASAPDGGPTWSYATVVNCFTNGDFVNLSAATFQNFSLEILAFNQSTWNAVAPNVSALTGDGGTGNLQTLFSDYAAKANWITTCTADEEQQEQVLAVCGVLVPQGATGDAAVADATSDASAPEASVDAPASDSPSDAPALPDAPSDATDGGAVADATGDAPADASSDAPPGDSDDDASDDASD